MSARTRPRFGSGFERLEDRWAPDVKPFTVNTAADTPDANPGDGFAKDANNMTSLRAAIEEMNAAPKTGSYQDNRYEVILNLPQGTTTITLASALPAINSNAQIRPMTAAPDGDPPPNPTIRRDPNAQTNFRIFEVNADREVHLESLDLTGGVSDSGGAVLNDGRLWLYKCNLYNNQATADGGAVYSGGQATGLYLDSCYLWYNQAVDYGGAIAAFDDTYLIISATDIFANDATGTGMNEGYGGGVYIDAPDAESSPWINRNTRIYGNSATKDGGGVYVWKTNLLMSGGEIHGNSAGGYGGGIYVEAPDKTVTISEVKLTNNSAGGKGGGAYIRKGTLKLEYLTAFSGNSATGGINGAGYKQNDATATLTNPPANPQSVEPDP